MSDTGEARCGFTTLALDGTEEPCDRPAPSWRWYQGHEHEDCLDRACIVHENPGGIRMAALEAEVRALRAKVEAVERIEREMRRVGECSSAMPYAALRRTGAEALAVADLLRDGLSAEPTP